MTPSSRKNFTRGCLPTLLVAVTAILGTLPTKAETLTPQTTPAIAQAASATQNQALQAKATQII